ncbi:MAG: hypothetical protein ACLSVD_01320 [Eggerthellaceae bacterium]
MAEVCMVDASDFEEAIKLYAECESGGISLGVATDQYPQSTQAAIGARGARLHDGLHRQARQPRQQPPALGGVHRVPHGLLWRFAYQFQTPENIQNRLGYVEHKGLGGWMHSHIPPS